MIVDQEFAPINLAQMEAEAATVLPQLAYDYYASGANDEITLAENQAAFKRIFLRPRMLVDVSKRSQAVNVLGAQMSMPVGIAPTAFQCMAHPDGEKATVRAAAESSTLMILSTLSNMSIEEVMSEAKGPVWFQLYVYKDRGITANLVERAQKAGCSAIVLTVDSPLLGRRERDVRNRFHLPDHLSLGNIQDLAIKQLPKDVNDSGLAAYIASLYNTSLTWDDVEWLRSITKLPLLVKGIMRGDDAKRAVAVGVSGIVVSNHGGRQLDTVPATITVLPEIVEAVNGEVEVLLDGGIRRGTDVMKALALGAKAVFVGRPVIWGLALNGQSGVRTVLELLRNELDLAMALAGCPSLESIKRDLIY